MNFSSDPLENPIENQLDLPPEKEASVEKRETSPAFLEFEAKLMSLPTPEEKIAYGLAFLRTSISQEGTPRFREFWEARRFVLPLFKETMNSSIRSKLWGEYVELTVEARRLKEILEEQSAFAIEQIDLAIAALENDIKNFETLLGQTGEIQFPEQSPTVQSKAAAYNQIQRELNLLNTLASRLNGLRKEVIKTDMRIRFKTKFFKRLSEIGDHVFPKRKQLIEQISQEFQKDVEQFVLRYFQGGQAVGAPYFALREEIKALQAIAKMLTLSSNVFNRTRLKLSECWDQIRALEKEHKKEVHAKRQVSQDNRQDMEKKIEELSARSTEMSLPDLDRAIEEISKEMRAVDLNRPDVMFLKDKLAGLRAPHLSAQEEKARAYEEAEREKLRLKRDKIAQLKEKIAILLKQGSSMETAPLEEAFMALKEEVKQLGASKIDQQQFDRLLRQLKDVVSESKERSLLMLSEGDRQALDNLRAVLDQKRLRRQEIKEQIENYRRVLGSSNLDFEKGMQVRELMEQEKELLEKTNLGILEIEEKISEFEG